MQVIADIGRCGLSVQVLCTDNYPLNVNLFKLFSLDEKTLQPFFPHPLCANKSLILMFDFEYIVKTIRNNWLNLKNDNETFIYPKLEDFFPTYTRYPLRLQTASFTDIRQIYRLEQNSIAKLAPRLTAKACWPSKLERQNVKLALRIFDDSTSAAIKICNESRLERFKTHTAEFIDVIVVIWKLFNVNRPNKDKRLNDEY